MEPGAPDWQIFGREDPAPAGPRAAAAAGPLAARRLPLPALIAAGLATALGVASVGLALAGAPDGEIVIDTGPAVAAASPAAAAIAARTTIVVDVAGAVVTPGLVRLPPGSRVGDAVAAAGGFAPLADLAGAAGALNLAAPLTDGAQVRVPSLATAGAPAIGAPGDAAAAGDARVDLNRASADALEALPGIGTVTAERIVAARAENPFADVEELRSRGLVGAATYAQVRDLVRAGP